MPPAPPVKAPPKPYGFGGAYAIFAAPNYCSSRRLNTSVNSATVSIIPMTMK